MNKRRLPPRRFNPCSINISSAAELQGRSLHEAVAELEQRMIKETLAGLPVQSSPDSQTTGLIPAGPHQKNQTPQHPDLKILISPFRH